ncbi:RDD family protein [Zobellella iuensis]|uniref:RDD family protein n=1 Tax=Zobellella iuensis TaxID=2803811 RepID=A0ABS1QNY5_9GAMM|nr:RDD family protein [Zobellella iuensis]MBL1376569.1 RDD family protein [Zobellella iuensis]
MNRSIFSLNQARYGGFWRRLFAYLIDVLLMALPIGLLLSWLLDPSLADPGEVDFQRAESLYGLVFWWLYFALLQSSPWQATLGKKLLGMKVTDAQGRRLSFVRASVRYLASLLSGALLMLGFLMIPFNRKKRGLHDFIAGTQVIRNR